MCRAIEKRALLVKVQLAYIRGILALGTDLLLRTMRAWQKKPLAAQA